MNLLIVGANGLVGQAVVSAALAAPDVREVRSLTRRPWKAPSTTVQMLTLDEYAPASLRRLDLTGLDACVHCAGVLPIGVAEETYRRLSVDLTMAVADAFFSANPAGRFVYVSGAGADATSRWLPLRVKGMAEASLRARFRDCVMLRPSVVAPARDVESPHALRRLFYALGSPLLRVVAKALPAAAIRSDTLGRAAIAACRPAVRPAAIDGVALMRLGG